MRIFECSLTTNDFFFFSSYEIDKLARTEEVIHCYALTYALNYISRIHSMSSCPSYDRDLTGRAFYATPARLLVNSGFVTHTYNAINDLNLETKIEHAAFPDYGKYTKLAPLSVFHFYVFSVEDQNVRRVVNIGKKDSIATVSSLELEWTYIRKRDVRTCSHVVSPPDVPDYLSLEILQIKRFYLIPPSYLYDAVQFKGKYVLAKSKDNTDHIIIPPSFIEEEMLL
ncbi:MAG: type I-D CRISPR-associated protein Cas5/Csc1 [Candidatus Methanofastidiosia archaeon]